MPYIQPYVRRLFLQLRGVNYSTPAPTNPTINDTHVSKNTENVKKNGKPHLSTPPGLWNSLVAGFMTFIL